MYMSNYKNITTRTDEESPIREIKKLTNLEVDDALCLNKGKHLYLGLVNYQKHQPILSYLMQDKDFSNYVEGLDKSLIIDYKNTAILPLNVQKAIKKTIKAFMNYGGHLNEKGEHIIDLFSPVIGPHYGVNLLLGDRENLDEPLLTTPKSVVDQFGGGSFRGPSSHQVLATRWDMLPEENGSPFNRQFYLLENGKQIFFSHDVHTNVKKAYCVHKVNQTEINYETKDGLSIKRIIYLRKQHSEDEPIALERQVVEITNLTNKARDLKIVFTGMFGSANPGCQMVDVIYQTVINQTGLLTKGDKNIAIYPDYYPEYAREYIRFFSLGEEGFDNFSYDSTSFIGNGNINFPQNINFLGNELRVKGPSFFAVDKAFHVDGNSSYTLTTSTGLVVGTHDFGKSVNSILKSDYQNELKEIEDDFVNYSSYLQIHSRNKVLNAYVNRNLPFQIKYQTFVSRAFAQTQKGYREIGFREIQDTYASMYYFIHNGQKDLVKKLLSKWIVNVYKFGYVNHNFFFVGKEPGMCSDDGLWLIEAISRYLSLSNDYEFLKEKFSVADNKEEKRSLYDTLKSIILYSSKISVGKHGIPLLDKADWNDCLKIDDDCLDGPTKEKLYYQQLENNRQIFGVRFDSDLSESVMNGFLLVIALKEMIEVSKHIGDIEYVKELKAIRDNLVKSLKENAYVDGYYARVLINKEGPYKYVGTLNDGLSITPELKGSLYLNSLSWSILADVASEEEIKSMISLADKYLKTPAGYKLCTPHDLKRCGSKEAATEQYFLGDRENGGVFKHATMMFSRALIKASRKVKDKQLKKTLLDDAHYMMDIVYPFNVLNNPYLYKGNPRLCTQYVNSLTQEHIGPVLSGTATWLLLAILEEQR